MELEVYAGFLEGGPEARESLHRAHHTDISVRYAAAVTEMGQLSVTLDEYQAHVLRSACQRVLRGHESGAELSLPDVMARLHWNDVYLALAMGAGDSKAWEIFALRFRDFLVKATRAFTREQSYADSVADDILGDLFFTDRSESKSRIASYTGASTLDRWLWLVLRNRVIDCARGRRNEISLEELPGAAEGEGNGAGVTKSAEDEVLDRRQRELLEQVIPRAFEMLEAPDRTLLKMTFVDQIRQRQIARFHDVHESRVSRWRDRACREVLKHATHLLTREHGLDFKEATDLVKKVIDLGMAGDVMDALRGQPGPDAGRRPPGLRAGMQK